MTTSEQRWRARWKAIAKYYRRLYFHPVTADCPQAGQPAQVANYCANCNATERRSAEVEAAIISYARTRRRDLREKGRLREQIETLTTLLTNARTDADLMMTAARAADSELDRIAALLPKTWYANCDVRPRIYLLVQQWQRLHGIVKASESEDWEDPFLPDAPPTEAEMLKFIEQGKRYGQMSLGETWDLLDRQEGELESESSKLEMMIKAKDAAILDAEKQYARYAAAQADAAAMRKELERLRTLFEKDGRFPNTCQAITEFLSAPNPGAPLLAELERLRKQVVAADEPEPPEYQRTTDPDC